MNLVFHHGALGDSVLLWPLLRAMGGAALVAPRARAKLAERCVAGVEAVDGEAPEWSRLFAPGAGRTAALGRASVGRASRPSPDPDRLLAGARRIVSFISDGRDAWARNIAALAPDAHRYFVRSRPAAAERIPVTDFHAAQLAEQGWPLRPMDAEPRRNSAGPVVVHPGSGGRDKCWPVDRFERLIDHLRDARPVVVALGEAERERMGAPLLARWRRRLDVRQPPDTLALADLLASAALCIGNDSGPTHLAAQLGVPTVALFGPTDPRTWAPRGPSVTVLHPPAPAPMSWLSVAAVRDAAARCLRSRAEARPTSAGPDPGRRNPLSHAPYDL